MLNLINNVKTIVTLVVILACVMLYAVNIYKKYRTLGKEAALADLRETAYGLFLKAEEKYGPKTGPDKMAWAVTQFYKLVIPEKIKELLPGTTVEKYLQNLFDNGYGVLKDFLDDGEINDSPKVAPPGAPKVIEPSCQITNTEKL